MRNTLPRRSSSVECSIVNLNGYVTIEITPMKIQRYLKTNSEFDGGSEVIERYTDIVQAANTSVWASLTIRTEIVRGQFLTILNHMQHCGYS